MLKHRWRLKIQVLIPAQDYDIDRSEAEILCHYSNSRALGDMCCLQYRTKRRCYQACLMCLSIVIIPILQWHRIDGAVVVWIWEWGNPIDKPLHTNRDSRPRSAPTLELHSRAASSVGITSPLQRSRHRKQFQRKANNNNKKTPFTWGWRGMKLNLQPRFIFLSNIFLLFLLKEKVF